MGTGLPLSMLVTFLCVLVVLQGNVAQSASPVQRAPDIPGGAHWVKKQPTSIVVGWEAPINNGSSPLAYYNITTSRSGFISTVFVLPGAPLLAQFQGLAVNTRYDLFIRAVNQEGLYSVLDLFITTPSANQLPPLPGRPAVSALTRCSATLTLTIPTQRNASKTGLTLIQRAENIDFPYAYGTWTTTPLQTTATLRYDTYSTMTNGRAFISPGNYVNLSVIMINSEGSSDESYFFPVTFPSGTTVPAPPEIYISDKTRTSLEVWIFPSECTGGLPVTAVYLFSNTTTLQIVDIAPGAQWTVYNWTGLAPGSSHQLHAQARNQQGSSFNSFFVSETTLPVVAPSSPLNLQAYWLSQTLVLSWNYPADDGGSPVVFFTITYSYKGGFPRSTNYYVFSTTLYSYTITNDILLNKPYTISVSANTDSFAGPSATIDVSCYYTCDNSEENNGWDLMDWVYFIILPVGGGVILLIILIIVIVCCCKRCKRNKKQNKYKGAGMKTIPNVVVSGTPPASPPATTPPPRHSVPPVFVPPPTPPPHAGYNPNAPAYNPNVPGYNPNVLPYNPNLHPPRFSQPQMQQPPYNPNYPYPPFPPTPQPQVPQPQAPQPPPKPQPKPQPPIPQPQPPTVDPNAADKLREFEQQLEEMRIQQKIAELQMQKRLEELQAEKERDKLQSEIQLLEERARLEREAKERQEQMEREQQQINAMIQQQLEVEKEKLRQQQEEYERQQKAYRSSTYGSGSESGGSGANTNTSGRSSYIVTPKKDQLGSYFLGIDPETMPWEKVTLYRYKKSKQAFEQEEIKVKIDTEKWQSGEQRDVFRMIKKGSPKRFLAKRTKHEAVSNDIHFEDAKVQHIAGQYAKKFNAKNPPKPIKFLKVEIIQLENQINPVTGEPVMYSVEEYMEGEYMKHNNNTGYVNQHAKHNTPHAFSHFTYEESECALIVVDVQGVDDVYTDPQIHSADGEGYGVGNKGPVGIQKFFFTHTCNPICKYLGLQALKDESATDLGATMLNMSRFNVNS